MEATIQLFGVSYLFGDKDPEKVLTSEDLGNEERRLFQKQGLPDFA